MSRASHPGEQARPSARAASNAARLFRPVSESVLARVARSWCDALDCVASTVWLVSDRIATTASSGARAGEPTNVQLAGRSGTGTASQCSARPTDVVSGPPSSGGWGSPSVRSAGSTVAGRVGVGFRNSPNRSTTTTSGAWSSTVIRRRPGVAATISSVHSRASSRIRVSSLTPISPRYH